MSEKENGPNDTEREELLQNWNENETFATSEATSRVSDVELLKVQYPTTIVVFSKYMASLKNSK